MKLNLFSTILFILFTIAFSNNIKSQETPFKGKRYTFDLNDQKKPSFSEQQLITDLSTIKGVVKCKYFKDKKKVVIYATSLINLPMVRIHLKKQDLGISNFEEEDISVNNLEATSNETK